MLEERPSSGAAEHGVVNGRVSETVSEICGAHEEKGNGVP
jgi:hypothetical protein